MKLEISAKNNKLGQKEVFWVYLTEKNLHYCLVIFSFLLCQYYNWEIQSSLVFSFVIWMILTPIQSKILIKISFFLYILVPMLLIVHKMELADQFATAAYELLLLAWVVVAWGFVQETRKRT